MAWRSVSAIEQQYDVSVVLLRHDGKSDYHPAGEREVSAEDIMAVLAGPEQIGRLLDDNNV